MSRGFYDPAEKPTDLCCPHCGGDGGFTHRYTQSYTSWILWNGHVDSTSEGSVEKEYKRHYCVDCGKNVTAYVNKHLTELGIKS